MLLSFFLTLLLNNLTVLKSPALFNDYMPLVWETVPAQSAQAVGPTKKVIGDKESLGVTLSASSAVVVDVASGKLLFSKNAEEVRSIASLTKLMSALVFLEQTSDLNRLVTMSLLDELNADAPVVYRHEILSQQDLLYASLISSDNNSTLALARSLGITMTEFVDLMNQKAIRLGLTSTKFVEPTGVDQNNVSSVYDISKLAYAAFTNPTISYITTQASYVLTVNETQKRTIYSTDQLLDSFINQEYKILGGKTGFINEAGYCLTIEVENKDHKKIIVVILGSKTNGDRFADVKALTAWTFENYQW